LHALGSAEQASKLILVLSKPEEFVVWIGYRRLIMYIIGYGRVISTYGSE